MIFRTTTVFFIGGVMAIAGCGGKTADDESGKTPAAEDPVVELKIDRTDPLLVARTLIERWREKDSRGMLALSLRPGNRLEPGMEKGFEPGGPRYHSLFGEMSPRMKAVKAWQGKLGRVRYDRRMFVLFESEGKDDAAPQAAVGLVRHNGKWAFSGIFHPVKSRMRQSANHLTADTKENADDFQAARKLASEALESYRKKDVARLRELAPPDGFYPLNFQERLKSGKPTADRPDSASKGEPKKEKQKEAEERLFAADSKEFKEVKNWDGKTLDVWLTIEARIEFSRINANEIGIVTMIQADGKWYTNDIRIRREDEFLKWGEPAATKSPKPAPAP